MKYLRVRLLALAVAAGGAWAAYKTEGVVLGTALLALICAGVIGFLWKGKGAPRRRSVVLHDPAISTLVFPPESKFRQSVLPPR